MKKLIICLSAVVAVAASAFVAHAEGNVQYVATNGNDSNDGLTAQTPKLTIAAAVAAVEIPAEGNAEVIVANGTYPVTATIVIDKAVTVRSSSGNPEDVTISKKSGDIGLVKLDNATAKLKDLTVSGGGNKNVDGGNVSITANGGIVEHCVLTGGAVSSTYGKRGGNIFMQGGVVTRCVIKNGTSNYNGGGGGVWMSGGQLENSLVYGNLAGGENGATYSGDAGGGVRLTDASCKVVNCTFYANRGASRPGVKIDYDSKAKAPKGSVINCVIVDNLTMSGGWDFFNVGGDKECAAGFVNCMTDAALAQPNNTCFGMPFAFLDRGGKDYHLTAASSGVDSGASVSLYSNLDLDGNSRVSGSSIDVGCYELQQGTIQISAGVSDEEILVDEEVTLSAAIKGGAADGDITWDFGGGDVATGASIVRSFSAPGKKSVTVSATVGGVPVSRTVQNLVKVCAKDIYVNAKGTAVFPYATVETGATSFPDAIADATDGTTLHITNGFYLTTAQTFLNKAIHVEGIGDTRASVVITNRAVSRIFWMSHPNAQICNLTIAGGKVTQAEAGNVYITGRGGTVSNCVISAGFGDNYNANSGNLTMACTDAFVTHCEIVKGKLNTAGGNAKGCNVNMSAGRLAHSLIAEGTDSGKAAGSGFAGGVRITGGRMEFCTIANNTCQTTGGVYAENATIENCVIAGNTSTVTGGDAAAYQLNSSKMPTFSNCYSDTSVAINESCFTATAAELLADPANGNYQAAIGSPSIDKGSTSGVLPATDLAGNPRVLGAAVDIGCYEYVPPAFAVNFTADAVTGHTPATIVFTATTEGGDPGDTMSYQWDFEGDGIYDETTTIPTVSHEYTTGAVYTVGLKVTDVTKSLVGTVVRENYIKIAPKTLYVDCAVEEPVSPYATWATAATNISAAIEASIDGCEIIIRAGEYRHASRPVVEKSLYIHSETGRPEDVVVRSSGNTGIVFVNGKNLLISGMTFTDGFSSSSTDAGLDFGANGGTVSNCVIRNCSAQNWSGSGSGVYSSLSDDALVTHCVISNCSLTSACGGGTKYILYMSRGRIENTLVTGCFGKENPNPSDCPVSLMYVGAEASVTNCTFVANNMRYCGLMNFGDGASVANCVFADNFFLTPEQMTALELPAYQGGFVYSGSSGKSPNVDALVNCAVDLAEKPNETCVLGTTSTFFNSYATKDYVPKAGGELVDAGITPAGWADMTDLAGKSRVCGTAIDIGCYELQSAAKKSGLTILIR